MSHRRPDPDAKIALPITPMLDMTFQLLFFFIMNFNPVDVEGQMHMALPAEELKDPKRIPVGKGVGGNVAEEFPADLTVEVRTRNDENGRGGISALFVEGLDGKSQPIDGLDALGRYLVAKRATLTRPESIEIRGDSRLHLEHLMKVIDVCKASGFANTSLIPPHDIGR